MENEDCLSACLVTVNRFIFVKIDMSPGLDRELPTLIFTLVQISRYYRNNLILLRVDVCMCMVIS